MSEPTEDASKAVGSTAFVRRHQRPTGRSFEFRGVILPPLVWRVMWDFLFRYRVKSPDEIEPTETRGYWRFKKQCCGECGEGHTRPMHHTLYFAEHGLRVDGKFVSPYRAWNAWRDFFKTNVSGEARWGKSE